MKGCHVRWVDQKTFLPLKMEMHDQSGALVDRYEVTSIEYDVEIPTKTFTELPAGTTANEPKMMPLTPPPNGGAPVTKSVSP
jgi:negative regulator of sigma E activity